MLYRDVTYFQGGLQTVFHSTQEEVYAIMFPITNSESRICFILRCWSNYYYIRNFKELE